MPWFIVQLIFLILKGCGTIDWSWWWVWSPMLIMFGLGILIGIIAQIAGAINGDSQEEIMRKIRRWGGLG